MSEFQRVRISDPSHPHYPESGRFTGKIITMKFGDKCDMAEVALDNCQHGTSGCFVSRGQVQIIPEATR